MNTSLSQPSRFTVNTIVCELSNGNYIYFREMSDNVECLKEFEENFAAMENAFAVQNLHCF